MTTVAGRATPLLLASALFCCAATARAEGDWKVEKIELRTDDGKGGAGPVVKWFAPEDRTQYVVVKFASIKVGALKPVALFTAVSTAAGENVTVSKSEGGTALVGNEFYGKVKLPRDWPFGVYRFDLLMGAQKVASQTYHVIASPKTFKVNGFELCTRDAKGVAGPRVASFKTTDASLCMRVFTNGVAPGTKLKWIWKAVKTAISGEETIQEIGGTVEELGSYTLEPGIKFDGGLPVGQFRLELYLDGKQQGAFPFEVKK